MSFDKTPPKKEKSSNICGDLKKPWEVRDDHIVHQLLRETTASLPARCVTISLQTVCCFVLADSIQCPLWLETVSSETEPKQ